jgi:hypothetical protein
VGKLETAALNSPEVRTEKVQALKSQLQSGAYQVSSAQVELRKSRPRDCGEFYLRYRYGRHLNCTQPIASRDPSRSRCDEQDFASQVCLII